MTDRIPRYWCDPPEAFGQLTLRDNETPVPRREWLRERVTRPEHWVAFRAAVIQNAMCLYVRQAKNARPHPSRAGRSFPLTAFVAQDERRHTMDAWQRKMTGERSWTFEDLAVVMRALPGSLPSEQEIQVFLDVAEKQMPPPPGWGREGWLWPDS